MARDTKQHVSIRLPPKLLDQIAKKAQREDSDRSRVITDAVEAYVLPLRASTGLETRVLRITLRPSDWDALGKDVPAILTDEALQRQEDAR